MPNIPKARNLSLDNNPSNISVKVQNRALEYRQVQYEYNESSTRGGKKREKLEDNNQTNRTAKIVRSSRPERRDDLTYPVLSVRYIDPCLNLSEDRLTCSGFKGWSSIFATHCAEKGKWYYEVEILDPVETLKFITNPGDKSREIIPHIRLGWSCRYQRYDMPIGHDAFGYAIRDEDGSVVNSAIRKKYAEKSFGAGDIIGCYLSLNEPTWWLSDPRKDLKLYEYLQAGILCNPKEPPCPSPNYGSFVEFSINGCRNNIAFNDIHNGAYHPAISLYMGSKVKVNFGPNFKYNFNSSEGWRPACELMRSYVL